MATLQVKNLSDTLHEELRHRASAEGTTLSEYVTRIIRRELALPSMDHWLAELATATPHDDIDTVALIDEVRATRA